MTPPANLLVGALSPRARRRLERVELEQYAVVLEPGQPPAEVYFPEGSAASLMLAQEDGRVAQVAMVGREGMLGVDLFLGGHTRVSGAIALVHAGGPAWRLSAADLQRDLAEHPPLQQRLMRYTLALVSQMARIAACQREHSVEKQVCRWILQTLDRAPASCIRIGAESIANLIGARREAVRAALRHLQERQLLTLVPGGFEVSSRAGIEARCCACYRTVRESEMRALLQQEPASWPRTAAPGRVRRAAGA